MRYDPTNLKWGVIEGTNLIAGFNDQAIAQSFVSSSTKTNLQVIDFKTGEPTLQRERQSDHVS